MPTAAAALLLLPPAPPWLSVWPIDVAPPASYTEEEATLPSAVVAPDELAWAWAGVEIAMAGGRPLTVLSAAVAHARSGAKPVVMLLPPRRPLARLALLLLLVLGLLPLLLLKLTERVPCCACGWAGATVGALAGESVEETLRTLPWPPAPPAAPTPRPSAACAPGDAARDPWRVLAADARRAEGAARASEVPLGCACGRGTAAAASRLEAGTDFMSHTLPSRKPSATRCPAVVPTTLTFALPALSVSDEEEPSAPCAAPKSPSSVTSSEGVWTREPRRLDAFEPGREPCAAAASERCRTDVAVAAAAAAPAGSDPCCDRSAE